jgi:hypothetical protein
MSRQIDSALTGRAFRVHFRADADLARGVCSGRVEHLRSGDAAHFSTVQELLAFVDFWLSRRGGPGVRRARLRPVDDP